MAVQHIRRMRGGAQGQLMLGADGNLWVVKFQNNPQHMRVLANEMLGTRLASAAGLTVPETAVIEVSGWLIENTPELEVDQASGDGQDGGQRGTSGRSQGPGSGHGSGLRRVRCAPGLQFGARHMGGLMPGLVVDYLPEAQLMEIRNLEEFRGVLALDKWTGNINGRQAIFTRKARESRYRACFVDQGYCFHAGEWRFEDIPLRGVYPRNAVYQGVGGWADFEPWLTRMETMDAGRVWAAAEEIPPEWYGGDLGDLEALVETLIRRQGKIRDLIEDFGRSDREPFPNWAEMRKTMLV